MGAQLSQSVEVFFSYAPEDELLQQRLQNHLRSLERQGLVSAWHDHLIQAGQDWKYELYHHLKTSHIILLLISPDYLASDRCYQEEMMHAMQRHKAGNVRVIPIILRPVFGENEPFSILQVLPTGGKAVKKWSNLDDAFSDIAKHLQRIVKELLTELLLKEAEHLYSHQRFTEALTICEQTIHLNIRPAVAYYRRGNILLESKHYEKALYAYQEACRLDPNLADLYFYQSIGDALFHLGRYEEAFTAYNQAIQLSQPNLYSVLSKLYHCKGEVLLKLAEQAFIQAGHDS